uniref:NADH-ubiquinone oxidoreductase chain 6 n=1 Tax=Lyroderma lyra TaxID=3371112 RepID=A0A343X9W8_LYRLY|nr:NADH dehydrogenase subunit 6 [Megaderma lyra]
MMTYVVFILGVMFVVSFVGFSSKPSPIYGGFGLIVGGGLGCGIVMSSGGPFLGLMVFLIYLGGMLVVFGYTTAMAMEQYPEVWVSNKVVLGSFVSGLIMESVFVSYVLGGNDLGTVSEAGRVGDWAVYEGDDFGVLTKEAVGVAALYSYGAWLVVVTGWALLMGVVVVMEVTRGG